MDINVVIKIVGLIIFVAAIAYLAKPSAARWMMEFFKKGRRLYFVGLLRIGLAVVFLLGARQSNVVWLITAFGIMFLISGILIFVLPVEKLRSIFDWYLKQSLLTIRILGAITAAIGVGIIYGA